MIYVDINYDIKIYEPEEFYCFMKNQSMIKKVTAFFVMLTMMAGLLSPSLCTVSAEEPPVAGANGFIAEIDRNVPNTAIYISTAEQFAEIGEIQTVGMYYILVNDIHLTEEWVPIGDFQGTFDGQGYTINNLYVLNGSNRKNVGLFAKATNATIKNVGVNISLLGVSANTQSDSYAGGLIGYCDGGTITNCYATGAVTFSASNSSLSSSSPSYTGGLIGYCDGGTVTNCYATGMVTSSASYSSSPSYTGGLIGYYSGVIMNCYATGAVSSASSYSYSYTGGLIGYNGNSIDTITNCYATGVVTSSASNHISYAGGLIGYSNGGTITNCYATGAVSSATSNSYAGGLIGYSNGGIITNCYATGAVTSLSSPPSPSYAGGLIGYCNKGIFTITNCYTTGNVTAKADRQDRCYVGRLIGYSSGSSIILLNGNHISQTMSIGETEPLGQPISFWAVEGVFNAVKEKLVPEELQNSFGNEITRAEFAALAVTLYEKVLGPLEIERTELRTFIDTDDENVEKAAALGVVLGVGGNRFDPDSSLTREQAAVMLTRLAGVIGKPLPGAASIFADNASISSWAIDGVGQIQAAGIMQGIGENKFAPQDPYTREQSILTILRLFNFVK